MYAHRHALTTLYVTFSWSKGARITTTHIWDKPGNKYAPLGLPVQQPSYEYGLYRLSAALYPDCPSAGYEWLRCGRTLWYAPWYGRGFLQLTNPGNYCDYWAWRGRHVDPALRRALVAAYDAIRHMPGDHRFNERLRDEHFPALTAEMIQWRDHVASATQPPKGSEDFFAPSDSAGFYWVKNLMAQYADEPHELERCAVQTDHGQKVYYRSTGGRQLS